MNKMKRCLGIFCKRDKPDNVWYTDSIIGETEIRCVYCQKLLYYWVQGHIDVNIFLIIDIPNIVKSFFNKYKKQKVEMDIPF